jgi:hypothetical protein
MARSKTSKKPAVRLPARSEYIEGREDQPPAKNPGVRQPLTEKKKQPVNLNKRPDQLKRTKK